MIQGVTLLGVVMPSGLFSKGLSCSLSSGSVLVLGKRWLYWLFWQAADWLVAFSNWGQRGNLDFPSAPISHSFYYGYVIVVMLFLSSCSWNMCEKIKTPIDKYTDCIGIVFSVSFLHFFPFFYFYFLNVKKKKKKGSASGMCFVVLKLFLCPWLTLSKCLFAFSAGPSPFVCCESWRRPSVLSWEAQSLQTCS